MVVELPQAAQAALEAAAADQAAVQVLVHRVKDITVEPEVLVQALGQAAVGRVQLVSTAPALQAADTAAWVHRYTPIGQLFQYMYVAAVVVAGSADISVGFRSLAAEVTGHRHPSRATSRPHLARAVSVPEVVEEEQAVEVAAQL